MADRTADTLRTPALPQCCVTHRLAALEVVETVFVTDVLASYDRRRDHADGCAWPADAAVDALRHGYKSWVLAHIADAIDLACDLLELEVAA